MVTPFREACQINVRSIRPPSRQLGHPRPSITLDIYAHEFDHARGLDDFRDSIDAAFGAER
jgi:hypothetical protein